ncbi:hypothetical protein CDV55_100861 [Aspergillus turcosus]|uniref:Uncharacterized protein n=1 Tax=Aspergillus turcosus TaxID=1245748 RepID=A0A397HMU3_9EURO|nr:hypothetical protein CDV55_100861 [Aspergillus turcosus]RLL95247.1 hypothetical protein CFD26_100939 [Aspergillus turcosus]
MNGLQSYNAISRDIALSKAVCLRKNTNKADTHPLKHLSVKSLLKTIGISHYNGFDMIISSLAFIMASNASLSHTIQSLTVSKIRELRNCGTPIRLKHLLVGTKELYPGASRDVTIGHIERWLDQARYDSRPRRKLSLADLYARLLTEWMNPSNDRSNPKAKDDPDDEDFLIVEERQKQRLQRLCDQFEAVVFEPHETEEQEIHTFLEDLFVEDSQKLALNELRDLVNDRCQTFWTAEEPFNRINLSNCIKGLLTQDLLSDGKRAVLKDFLDNENSDWHTGEKGIPVLPRQQTNGKYRVWVDEDVLETIFAEFIAIKFCSSLKHLLGWVITQNGVWKFSPGPQMTERDILRRCYYLNPPRSCYSVEKLREDEYKDTYFLSHLPRSDTSLFANGPTYDDEDAAATPAQKAGPNKNIKQRILRKVATETLLHQHLYGEAAVIQSDMKLYGNRSSARTLFAILRFVGFHEEWINFFTKYFHSPLNMDRSCDGRTPTGP